MDFKLQVFKRFSFLRFSHWNSAHQTDTQNQCGKIMFFSPGRARNAEQKTKTKPNHINKWE